jgi:hypothetical protein
MSSNNKKQTLTIIVNGVPAVVERNENAPLVSAIERALSETGNVGQPLENWELRDGVGNVLDLHAKIGAYNFPDDIKLFLSLKAGVGGC